MYLFKDCICFQGDYINCMQLYRMTVMIFSPKIASILTLEKKMAHKITIFCYQKTKYYTRYVQLCRGFTHILPAILAPFQPNIKNKNAIKSLDCIMTIIYAKEQNLVNKRFFIRVIFKECYFYEGCGRW